MTWVDIGNFAGWIIGGGALSLGALAFFAPSAFNMVFSWGTALSPLIKGVSEGIVWFGQSFWAGFKDMIDDVRSVMFVFVMMAIALAYGASVGPSSAPGISNASFEQRLQKIRVDYKFVKRTPQERADYLRSIGKSATRTWLDEFFSNK